MKKTIIAFAALALLSACQTSTTKPRPQGAITVSRAALPVMERVALGARECWFRSKDPAFKAYRLSPELTSQNGRPRILIVPAKNPNGLPLAVVEATGNPARLSAFGPLMNQSLGKRITSDVNRWIAGSDACGAAG
jgi:Prokaryotic membrane lipoprotein lipid attachment site